MLPYLSAITFTYPWVLFSLLTLPAFYWLIRITPPKPKSIAFSAVQFLLGLKDKEETTISTPWWLLLLRLMIAALVIISIAQPKIFSEATVQGDGPVVLLVDNDWASAVHWQVIEEKATSILNNLKTENRLVYLVPLAGWPLQPPSPFTTDRPEQALEKLASLKPVSWDIEKNYLDTLLKNIRTLKNANYDLISDATISGSAPDAYMTFLQTLDQIGTLTIYKADRELSPIVIETPRYDNGGMIVPVHKIKGGEISGGALIVKSLEGYILAQQEFTFDDDQDQIDVSLKFPNDIYNKIKSLQILENQSAASIYFMDARNKRKNVGLVVTEQSNPAQTLLSESHYLEKALAPFYVIKTDTLENLLDSEISIIFMGDIGTLIDSTEQKVRQWIEKGGTLVRFSGPKLANTKSQLTPTPLREGSRSLDGSISWSKPATLGAFSDFGPFARLTVPAEVTVKKQLLAIPSVDLTQTTWASLSDGTPLVTGARWKAGHIVLFHTTATPNWSNLTLSGLFVEMLREIGQLGRNTTVDLEGTVPLPAYQLIDGFGHFSTLKQDALPLNFSATTTPTVTSKTPAGYYGDTDFQIALNVGDTDIHYAPMDFKALGADTRELKRTAEIDLKPNLLLIVILLALIDLLIVLHFKGAFEPLRKHPSSLSVAIVFFFFGILIDSSAVKAEEDLERIMAATLDTRLAYVRTGDQKVDQLTAAGLAGLSLTLTRRTSVETAPPMQVDLEKHELLFYPFVYWPITSDFPRLSEQAIAKVNTYLKEGGTIVFDTRNQHKIGRYGGNISNNPENIRLQQIVGKLQIPLLNIVPIDHVLTRSFYLMQSFPGRYEAGNVWVSATSDGDGTDGVSSIIIGSNDWAAAWAMDGNGRPLVSVIPGGETQREHAHRFGVNLAMYTLTGSYKADQVHIPTILNRLSQ